MQSKTFYGKPLTHFEPNEACPCGSQRKFKRCCAPASGREAKVYDGQVPFNAVIADFSKRSCIHTCLHPASDDCNRKVVRAHSIQRSRFLQSISEDGHVYSIRASGDELGFRVDMDRMGTRVASTFTGFCSHHDLTTFRNIETVALTGGQEQLFLLSYRTLVMELWKKLRSVRLHQLMFKERPDLATASFFVQSYRANTVAVEDLERSKSTMDARILDARAWNVVGEWVELDVATPFAAACGFYLAFDLDGEPVINLLSEDRRQVGGLMLNVLPYEGRTLISLTCLAHHRHLYESFFRQWRELSSADKCRVVDNLVCCYCENVFFRPSFWEGLGVKARESMQAVWMATLRSRSDTHAKALLHDAGFSLLSR